MAKTVPRIEQQKSSDRPLLRLLRSCSLRVSRSGGHSTTLVRRWLDRTPHPVVALAVVLALEAMALGVLLWNAGWAQMLHAIAVDNFDWFALCAVGQLIAYFGYAIALRATAQVDRGVRLPFPAALAVVSAGFGPLLSANASGGFSVDYVTLRQAGMGPRRAFRVVAYRLFNFWLALLPMAIVLPFTHRVERQIASSPGS